MATTNCIYKSVVLSPGETFVLPPGAELISASDPTAITNSCGDTIPITETKCYRIKWILNVDPEGGRTVFSNVGFPFPGALQITIPSSEKNAWEDSDGQPTITIPKIGGGGQVIDTGGIDCKDLAAIEGVIANSAISGLITDRRYFSGNVRETLTTAEQLNWGNQNQYLTGHDWYEVYFKSTATFGPDIYFEFGGGGNIGDVPRYFPIEIDCVDYPLGGVITC